MDALEQRLPPFARPPKEAPVPASSIWNRPSVGARVVRGAGVATAAVVDASLGTVWSAQEFLRANKQIATLLEQDADLRHSVQQHMVSAAVDTPTHWRTALKNCNALLLRNRHDRHQQKVRRAIHGATTGVGGAAYGLGWGMQPTVLGLGHFAGYPAAVVTASTILLWVGAPLLSAAAVGVAVHEGVRLHRNHRGRSLFGKLLKNPVLGSVHEAGVHQLLVYRANQVRLHGAVKLGAMAGFAAGLPLLVVGFAPGVAVLAPAAVGAGWASYYLHGSLAYTPQLSTSELLMMRRRDLMNRIELAHSEYACLKALKQEKRLRYARGAQGPLAPVARVVGGVRRWVRTRAGGAVAYAPAHVTVARYLRAQQGAEETFIRNQVRLHAHTARKTSSDAQERAELALLDAMLHAADARRRAVALPPLAAGNAPREPADAARVAVAFAQHVERHGLDAHLLQAIRHDPRRAHLQRHAILLSHNATASLDLPRLRALCAPDSPLGASERAHLGSQIAALAERFLLTTHKLHARYARDQLLDYLGHRLHASTRADYPSAAAGVAPAAAAPA